MVSDMLKCDRKCYKLLKISTYILCTRIVIQVDIYENK